jgi:hypothetical protein
MKQTFPATVVAIVFIATTICPTVQAQTVAAGNTLPDVAETSVLSSDVSTSAQPLSQAAAVTTNPIAASVEAAVWPASERVQSAGEQAPTQPAAKADHHRLFLTAGILGSAAFGLGLAVHSLASSNCKTSVGVCGGAETFGNVLMPVGAIAAGLGFFFAFHHSD